MGMRSVDGEVGYIVGERVDLRSESLRGCRLSGTFLLRKLIMKNI